MQKPSDAGQLQTRRRPLDNPSPDALHKSTFRPIAYRNFKHTLGKLNAIVEGAELATRKLKREAESSPDQAAFIKQLSIDHCVRVDTLDFILLHQLTAQFFIVSVHQQFEIFLKSLETELSSFEWMDIEGESLLKEVLSSLPRGYNQVVGSIGRWEIEIADYYRLVRNEFVHTDGSGIIKKDAERLRSKLQQEGGKYSRLDAPNVYSSIGFDDFVLFSRVVKEIALGICILARPHDSEIVAMLMDLNERKLANVDFVSLRRKRRNPDRLKRAVQTLLRSVYSLNERESGPIIELLRSGPLA